MSRTNYLYTIIFCPFLTVCCLCGEILHGSTINFTLPKNYDSTSTLADAQYEEGELIVHFAPKANGIQRTTFERNAILVNLGGGEVKHTFKLVPGLSLIKLQAGVKVVNILTDFNKSPEIVYAQPNYILRAFSTFPSDSRGPNPDNGGEQWCLHNIGQPYPTDHGEISSGTPDADIDAPAVWLDPEVQENISEADWLKFIESLKSELE